MRLQWQTTKPSSIRMIGRFFNRLCDGGNQKHKWLQVYLHASYWDMYSATTNKYLLRFLEVDSIREFQIGENEYVVVARLVGVEDEHQNT